MVRPEILEKKPITIAEVKDSLNKIQKRDEELNFRGGKTIDHVNEVPTISVSKTKEFYKKIEALEIPRLKDIHIVKIIDTMPESHEQLKVIISGYNATITKENMQKIVDVVDEYRPMK